MLKTFPPYEELRELIQLAKREDLGGGDITSRLLVEENLIGVGTLIQKEVGIPCGMPIVEMICRTYDERLRVEQIPGFHMEVIEGRFSDARTTPLLRIRGPMRSLLSAERVILNFLQHLSGQIRNQRDTRGLKVHLACHLLKGIEDGLHERRVEGMGNIQELGMDTGSGKTF